MIPNKRLWKGFWGNIPKGGACCLTLWLSRRRSPRYEQSPVACPVFSAWLVHIKKLGASSCPHYQQEEASSVARTFPDQEV